MITELVKNIIKSQGARIVKRAEGADGAENIGKIYVKGEYFKVEEFVEKIFSQGNRSILKYLTDKNLSPNELKDELTEAFYAKIDGEVNVKENKPLKVSEQIALFFKELGMPTGQRESVSDVCPVIKFENIKLNEESKAEDGRDIHWTDIVDYYIETCQDNSSTFTKYKNAKNQLRQYLKNKEWDWVLKLRDDLKFDEASIKNADYFLTELYKIYKPSFITLQNGLMFTNLDLFKACIKHFIWEVKRRGIWQHTGVKDSTYLLCLTGGQGCGKTTFFEHLCEPLQTKYKQAKLKIFDKSFEHSNFIDNWVLNLDDMVSGSHLEIQGLKKSITDDYIEDRIMYTADSPRFKRYATFCGTANEPVYSICKDETETGSRRFINIEFACESIVYNKDVCNRLTELFETCLIDLWKSVDENKLFGYFDKYNKDDEENIKRLTFARNFYIPSSKTAERWMNERDYKLVNVCSGRKNQSIISLEDGYKLYTKWCKEEELKAFTKDKFISFMRSKKNNAQTTKLGFKETGGDVRLREIIEETKKYFDPLDDEAVANFLEKKHNDSDLDDIENLNDVEKILHEFD